MTQEHKMKISQAMKGRMPKNISSIAGWNKGTKGVMVAWNKGLKGYMAGSKHYCFGTTRSDETKEKISEKKIGSKMGQENPNYKNGLYTLENRLRYWHYTKSFKYKQWRKTVFTRDGYKCKNCDSVGYITAHHIKSWAKHPALRYEVTNGVTLCEPCHSLTDNYKGRGIISNKLVLSV